jgi:hypothetical protein
MGGEKTERKNQTKVVRRDQTKKMDQAVVKPMIRKWPT